MTEIFDNGYIQIFYDDYTKEVSIAWRREDLTEFECLVLEKIFGEENEN